MAALSLVWPIFSSRLPFYGGNPFHLGNTFTALTHSAGSTSRGLAGAIGLALADLAGDPGYAVTTFVLKFLIGICLRCCGPQAAASACAGPPQQGVPAQGLGSCRSGLLLNVFHQSLAGVLPQRVHFSPAIYCGPGRYLVAGGADPGRRRRFYDLRCGALPGAAPCPGACQPVPKHKHDALYRLQNNKYSDPFDGWRVSAGHFFASAQP